MSDDSRLGLLVHLLQHTARGPRPRNEYRNLEFALVMPMKIANWRNRRASMSIVTSRVCVDVAGSAEQDGVAV
jgi:hypothetical protein